MDVANSLVFVRAQDIGLTGTDLLNEENPERNCISLRIFFVYYLADSETGYLPAPVSENVDRGSQSEFDVYLIQPSLVEAAKRTMPLI